MTCAKLSAPESIKYARMCLNEYSKERIIREIIVHSSDTYYVGRVYKRFRRLIIHFLVLGWFRSLRARV